MDQEAKIFKPMARGTQNDFFDTFDCTWQGMKDSTKIEAAILEECWFVLSFLRIGE